MRSESVRSGDSSKNEEIGIEVIWIDTENPPSDTIGWVAKK